MWDTACRLPLPFSFFFYFLGVNLTIWIPVSCSLWWSGCPENIEKEKKESLLGRSPPYAHANKLAVKEMTKKWVEGFSFFLLHFICWPIKTSLTFVASIMNCRKRKTWHRESRNASSEVSVANERWSPLRILRCLLYYNTNYIRNEGEVPIRSHEMRITSWSDFVCLMDSTSPSFSLYKYYNIYIYEIEMEELNRERLLPQWLIASPSDPF